MNHSHRSSPTSLTRGWVRTAMLLALIVSPFVWNRPGARQSLRLQRLSDGVLWAAGRSGSGESTSRYKVLAPISHGNLTIFPVVADFSHDTGQFLTLDEGLRSGEVVVTEAGKIQPLVRRRWSPSVPHGDQVNQLVLVNNSDRPLILHDDAPPVRQPRPLYGKACVTHPPLLGLSPALFEHDLTPFSGGCQPPEVDCELGRVPIACLIEGDQPNGGLVARSGAYSVPNARFDLEPITRAQRDDTPVRKFELRVALHQEHEFMLGLIVPEPFRRCLAVGDDPLNADVGGFEQGRDKFVRHLLAKVSEEVGGTSHSCYDGMISSRRRHRIRKC